MNKSRSDYCMAGEVRGGFKNRVGKTIVPCTLCGAQGFARKDLTHTYNPYLLHNRLADLSLSSFRWLTRSLPALPYRCRSHRMPHAGGLIGGGHARGFARIAGETRDFVPRVAFARPPKTPAPSRFPSSKKAGQNQRFPTFSAPKRDLNSDPMTSSLVVTAKTTNKITVIHAH